MPTKTLTKSGICLLGLLLLAWTGLAAAETTNIYGVRVWAAPDHTRVVFDLSGPAEHELFRLENPDRVVIDFSNTLLIGSLKGLTSVSSEYYRQVRHAKRNKRDLRIVFDMQSKVGLRSTLLKPNQRYGYRLVVDLVNEEKRKTRLVSEDGKKLNDLRDLVIAIDAGHGGEDPGAIGHTGVREKDVVFSIAGKLEALVKRESGMTPVMIRSGDYFVGLKKRRVLARDNHADMFISIHADAFRKSQVRGSSVFVLSEKGASSEAARLLAESENDTDVIGGVNLDEQDDMLTSVLLDLTQSGTIETSLDLGNRILGNLSGIGRVHKRNVEHANFAVLRSLGIPSILVETGFISNRTEEKKLRDKGYQYRMAKAILKGIKSYFAEHAPPGTLLAVNNIKHVVERGDTLSELAQKYKVSTAAIRKMNALNSDMLVVGKVLRIPSS